MIRIAPLAALMALAPTAPASALDRGPPAQTLGPVKAPSMTVAGPNCLSTDGKFASDGTSSWEPSCFGTFLAPGQTVRVYPTRGTVRNPAPGMGDQPLYDMFTSNLIQSRANGAEKKETNGQFINLDVVGGPISAAGLDTTNATGQLISVRTRPGPNGDKPPTTWGHNVDFHIGPGSGNVQSYGVEYDMNNFNKDCSPGSGCLSSGIFFNGISGFANTSWLYSGGGSTQTRNLTGSITNNRVTRTAGEQFTPGTYLITVASTSYHVHFVDPNTVDGDEAIPNVPAGTAMSWANAMTHFGVFFQGENNVSDADLLLATSAGTAMRVLGNHHIGVDTSGDARMTYASVARPGQSACFSGFDACWSFSGGLMQYKVAGTVPLKIVAETGGVNGLRVTSGSTTAGPILEPDGPDTNIPLNIGAKGASQVQIRSDINVSSLAGTGNRFVCVNSTGGIYASAKACQ